MAGDIEAAHYYHLEEELQQERRERASGINTMLKGVLVILAALLLLFARWIEFFVILLMIGAIFLASGAVRHSRYEQQQARPAEKAKEKAKELSIHVHHVPTQPHHIVTRPHHILRHSVQSRLPFAFSSLTEQELVKRVVRENSGSSISALYKLYQLKGGALEHAGFAKIMHDLRGKGFVKVEKHIRFVDVEHLAKKPSAPLPVNPKKGMA